jgi:hypothetical protein
VSRRSDDAVHDGQANPRHQSIIALEKVCQRDRRRQNTTCTSYSSSKVYHARLVFIIGIKSLQYKCRGLIRHSDGYKSSTIYPLNARPGLVGWLVGFWLVGWLVDPSLRV